MIKKSSFTIHHRDRWVDNTTPKITIATRNRQKCMTIIVVCPMRLQTWGGKNFKMSFNKNVILTRWLNYQRHILGAPKPNVNVRRKVI